MLQISYRGIAQLVEQRSPKPRAVSSSLTTPAIQSGSNTAFEPLIIFLALKIFVFQNQILEHQFLILVIFEYIFDDGAWS